MFLWRNKQNYLLIITKYPPYLFLWHSAAGTHWGLEKLDSCPEPLRESCRAQSRAWVSILSSRVKVPQIQRQQFDITSVLLSGTLNLDQSISWITFINLECCRNCKCLWSTVKIVLIGTSEMFAVIIVKLELCGVSYDPRHEKTCLQGWRPGKTQTDLLSWWD